MKVFLSYAHSDGRQYVEKLSAALEKRAFTPWYDKRINPTRTFEVEIETAIEEAEAVIVCLTPAAVRKESFVRNEILYAQALKRPIYAARFGEVTPPATIIGHTWLEFFKNDWDITLDRLCEWLHSPPTNNITISTTKPDPFKPYLESALKSIVDGLRKRLIATEPLELDVHAEPNAVALPVPIVLPPDIFAQAFSAVRLRDDAPVSFTSVPTFINFAQAVAYFKGRVLLLGEPGAGKTITLMDYARKVFYDRLENYELPLPLFGLVPSWDAEKQTSLDKWLAQTHSLDASLVLSEINAGHVLFLLDGLDELGNERIDQETQELFDPCLRFIMTIHAVNPTNGIILTSRIEEYEQIRQKVALNGALRLQPLNEEQIQDYLSDQPELLRFIQKDSDMRLLATTPLLLSLLGFTYERLDEVERANLAHLTDIRELRDRVFLDYIRQRYRHEAAKRSTKMYFEEDVFLDLLSRLALSNATQVYTKANVMSDPDIGKLFRDEAAKLILLAQHLRILIPVENNSYRFVHLLLRDTLVYRGATRLLLDRSQSSTIRLGAAESLGEIRDLRGVESLVKSLNDPDKYVRSATTYALTRISDVRAIMPLIESLSDTDRYVRYFATIALGRIGDSRAVKSLAAALRDPHPSVRGGAATALGMIKDEYAIEYLIMGLNDSDEWVSSRAAFALTSFRNQYSIAALCATLGNSSKTVQHSAVDALIQCGELAVAPLISMLNDNDEDLRMRASEVLVRIGNRAVKILAIALEDPDKKASAGETLRQINTYEAIEALLEFETAQERNSLVPKLASENYHETGIQTAEGFVRRIWRWLKTILWNVSTL